MSSARPRTTIDLTHLKDRIENLRSDAAWKKLKLSAKVTVLLFEYLDILESGKPPRNGNRTANSSETVVKNEDNLNDYDCIAVAREIGIPEELALKLCEHLFEKKD
jgi:hypothetical protein